MQNPLRTYALADVNSSFYTSTSIVSCKAVFTACGFLMQVLRYLQAFASAFELQKYVRFDTEVTQAVPLHSHQDAQACRAQDQQSGNDESGSEAGAYEEISKMIVSNSCCSHQ